VSANTRESYSTPLVFVIAWYHVAFWLGPQQTNKKSVLGATFASGQDCAAQDSAKEEQPPGRRTSVTHIKCPAVLLLAPNTSQSFVVTQRVPRRVRIPKKSTLDWVKVTKRTAAGAAPVHIAKRTRHILEQ
jgi:hypothetical protein